MKKTDITQKMVDNLNRMINESDDRRIEPENWKPLMETGLSPD